MRLAAASVSISQRRTPACDTDALHLGTLCTDRSRAGRLQHHSLSLESPRVSFAAVGGTTLALLSQRSTSSQPAVSRQTLEQRQQPVRRTRRRGALTKTPTSFALVRIAAKTLATSVCEPVAT